MRLPASTAACAKGSTTPYLSSPLCLECAHAPHHARRAPRAAPPLLPPSATQQGGRGRHVVAGGCSCSAAVGRMQPLVGTCDAAGWPRVAKYAHTYILYYSLSKSVLPVLCVVFGFILPSSPLSNSFRFVLRTPQVAGLPEKSQNLGLRLRPDRGALQRLVYALREPTAWRCTRGSSLRL